MVEVVLVRHLMVDMVEEMVLVVEDQEVLVDQIVVEVLAKAVVGVQVVAAEIHQVVEDTLAPLDIMLIGVIMVETLVVTEPIRENVVAAVVLDTMAAVAAVDMIVTVLAAVAAVVQVSSLVTGLTL